MRFHAFNGLFFLLIPTILGIWVYTTFLSGERQPLFAEVWLAVFGGFLCYAWLWNLFGCEELEFAPTELVYRRVWFSRFTHTKTFSIVGMSAPEFAVWSGHRGGLRTAIGFHYCGETIRLCEGITRQEAKSLVEQVLRHLPELAPVWERYAAGAPTAGPLSLHLK